jgi:demethylmenaquinone methyltransferase / 2-methoxy-6-polyprenyl-1,4-benzoquinol methylase
MVRAAGEHQRQIRVMFDAIAHDYDRLNHLLSFGQDAFWRRMAARRARLGSGESALDIGVGTGDLAIAVLARSARDSRVVGLDLSGAMCRIAGRKALSRGYSARFVALVGSALDLPVPDGAFDRVISAFTMRSVGDLRRACCEMRRVLRRGGRAVILELSRPRVPLFGQLYRAYFNGVLPRLAVLLGGDRDAYAYLPASLAQYPQPPAFAQLLLDAGFARVRFRELSLGITALHEAAA